jgi:DNA-binding transcriptional MerR regulator
MFTVGGFARLAGVSAKVLRSWDERGLFRPIWVDRSTGYRYYSPAQLPELRRLLALRDLGLGLADLGRLVGGGADLAEVLVRRRAELEQERAEIDRRLAALDIRVTGADPAAGDVVVRPLAAETVATLDLALVPGGDDEQAFNELEAYVLDLGRRAARPPGALIDRDGAEGGDGAATIFVPVSRPIRPTDRIGCRRLEPTTAATVIHRGPYRTLPAARLALEQWVASAGLIAGRTLRVLYLQFGADPGLRVPPPYLVEDPGDFVTELQLPIESGPPGAEPRSGGRASSATGRRRPPSSRGR